mmetsp:Transcript_34161/g.85735  ORF Transcript_34161/g.85735 Transcript_34161/m.85735 type:complete len:336 (+) Transcript_34161:4067-5074(+)
MQGGQHGGEAAPVRAAAADDDALAHPLDVGHHGGLPHARRAIVQPFVEVGLDGGLALVNAQRRAGAEHQRHVVAPHDLQRVLCGVAGRVGGHGGQRVQAVLHEHQQGGQGDAHVHARIADLRQHVRPQLVVVALGHVADVQLRLGPHHAHLVDAVVGVQQEAVARALHDGLRPAVQHVRHSWGDVHFQARHGADELQAHAADVGKRLAQVHHGQRLDFLDERRGRVVVRRLRACAILILQRHPEVQQQQQLGKGDLHSDGLLVVVLLGKVHQALHQRDAVLRVVEHDVLHGVRAQLRKVVVVVHDELPEEGRVGAELRHDVRGQRQRDGQDALLE